MSAPWYGGSAPAVTSVGVTGEFLDQRTGLYHFRAKATVRRLGADHNGKITLLRARTWRDAFDQLDAMASSRLGLRRGTIRDAIIETLGYTSAELRRPFPTLTANVSYDVIVSVKGREPRRSDPAARRAKGPRSFVEPLSVGIPPGTHEVGVVGCFWPDESHPMTKPFASFVRLLLGAGKLGTAKKAGELLLAAAAGGPVAPLARILAGALAVQLGKSFLVTAVTCGASSSRISLRTKMPNVVGQDQDDALRELKARGVRVDLDVDFVRRTSCSGFKTAVKRQTPAPGALLTPGQTVFILVTHCVESAPPPTFSGEWKWIATNKSTGGKFEGRMTIVQAAGKVCAEWTFSGGGTANGTLIGRTWTASWHDGFGAGTWSLTLEADGKTFNGTQKIRRHFDGTNFEATIKGERTSATPAKKLNCNTLKVGP